MKKLTCLIAFGFSFAQPALARDYPSPPAPRNDAEAYVFVQGDISLVGWKKHYTRVVAIEVDPGSMWSGWSIDSTSYYPKPSVRLNKPHNGKLARCLDSSVANRGGTVVMYAPILNESTGRTIRCHISGYVRMTKP